MGTDQEGVIRLRTPYMPAGYYRNSEATKQHFEDGWFYPGDRGRLLDNGMLVLAGRESELINRGGTKVDPAIIDQHLLDYDGVADAAAFAFGNRLGVDDIGAALVVSERFDEGGLREDLIATLGQSHSPSVFVRAQKIPRNEMGKPLRGQLRARYAEMIRNR